MSLEKSNFDKLIEKMDKIEVITEEEKKLAKKAEEMGGESKLPKEDYIRLITLRYMRKGLSEYDATNLAKLTSAMLTINMESKHNSKINTNKLESEKN